MREIDNSGSEIFPMNEEVKGGKNHKKIVVGSLLAPVLAVAAAGLITLAAVAEMAENGSGSVWDSLPPPPVEEVLPPEEPVIPPEEPVIPPEDPVIPPEEPVIPPEEPEKKPEEPTTPPPTTPPPTTPPPTTPPPTTPPPTTPPPTTPPPFVPIYDPDPEPEPEVPSFVEPSLELSGAYGLLLGGDFGWVNLQTNVNFGSATGFMVSPVAVTQGSYTFDPADWAFPDGAPPWTMTSSSTGWVGHSMHISPGYAVETTPPLTVTVSPSYYYNGAWVSMPNQSISLSFYGG